MAKPGAAQALRYGPAPSWVQQVDAPAAPIPAGGGGSQLLLVDHQIRLGRGGEEMYSHVVSRVLNAAGLAANGAFQESWDPSTQVLTINHIRILRDGQWIDLLQGGAKMMVLQRETNLERFMLDGQLTATQQLDGLRIGDVIDIAVTYRHLDPAIGDISAAAMGLNFPGVASRARFRLTWSDEKPITWRVYPGMPSPTVSHLDGRTELLIDMANARAPSPPAQAPARFAMLGRLEATQFKSWGDVAGAMAPLFAKAEILAADSPVKAEAASIRAAAATPERQASLALAWVQRNVRYELVGMNDGGFVPATADQTWARRYGDCKGKTVLLLAMLHQLGIEAEPVLVNTKAGDSVTESLPHLVFDHVMVRAHIGGRWYFLDGTRPGDPANLDDLPTPPFHVGLPVRSAGSDLIKIDLPAPKQPQQASVERIDASAGLDAPAPEHAEVVWRGDFAVALAAAFSAKPHDVVENFIRATITHQESTFDIKSVAWTYDPSAATLTVRVDGLDRLDWRWNRDARRSEYEITGPGDLVAALPKRGAGPFQDAPYAVGFPAFSSNHVELVLPKGGAGFEIVGSDVDRTLGAVEISRKARLQGGVAILDTSNRSVAPEFPASQADAFNQFLQELRDDPVDVRAPVGTASHVLSLSGPSPRG
ncbi:MAG: DUF3857 domain-containing transglutaminase family protein [Caulobacterales bacterium]